MRSSDHNRDTAGENVLTDCKEDESSKYWRAPTGRTGSGAELVMDLGCLIRLERILIRNGFGDFGTEKFSVWGARSKVGPWVSLHRGTLGQKRENVRGI